MLRFLFRRQAELLGPISRRSRPINKLFSNTSNNSKELLDRVMWEKMPIIERMNLAMAHSDAKTAEIAYYKGLGFKKLGLEFSNDAITSFKLAVELDKSYAAFSEKQIAHIYKDLGNLDEACNYMTKAFDHLIEEDEITINKMKHLFSGLDEADNSKKIKVKSKN